jgi:hypothetical protein
MCGEAIQRIRSGRTRLPSRVEVTVKRFVSLPASAEEAATTPASSARVRSRT